MPIRIRLGLAFAGVTLVLITVGGLAFLVSFRNGLESSLEPGLQTQARALSQSARAGLTSSNLGGEGDASLRSRDEVAQVLDGGGRVVASTREAGSRPVIDRATIRTARTEPVFTNIRGSNEQEPFRAFATPVTTAEGRRIVMVATSLEPTNEAVARVRRALFVGGAIAVLLAGAGGWLLAAAALRPVERLRRSAAEISEHDSEAQLRVPTTRDEIAALATTMNELLERLHAVVGRQRAFVADAGHELRTPLGVLRTELELARRPQRTRAQLEDAIEHAAIETDRLANLTEELLLLARSEVPAAVEHTEQSELWPTVERSVAAVRERARQQQVALVLEGDRAIDVALAPTLVRRVVDNLLDNAVRYSPEGGTVTVCIERDCGDVVINVLDEGPGFPSEFLPHAFERFRRADDARSRANGGTGLGLAIVQAVALSHGGSAVAANRSPTGAIVAVRLPETM